MADPIQTEFIKSTLSYTIPGLDEEETPEKTEKNTSQTKTPKSQPAVWINSLGQTVKIHS